MRRRLEDGYVYVRVRRAGYTQPARRARYVEPGFTHVIVNPNKKRKK